MKDQNEMPMYVSRMKYPKQEMLMGQLIPKLPDEEPTKAETKTAELWYTYFKENDKTYRYLTAKIDEVEICFSAELRPQLAMISEKGLERINKDSWNERTVSQPLPTSWMKTGL